MLLALAHRPDLPLALLLMAHGNELQTLRAVLVIQQTAIVRS